jgi:hypothetical protein
MARNACLRKRGERAIQAMQDSINADARWLGGPVKPGHEL